MFLLPTSERGEYATNTYQTMCHTLFKARYVSFHLNREATLKGRYSLLQFLDEETGTEQLYNLPEVTQLANGKARL